MRANVAAAVVVDTQNCIWKRERVRKSRQGLVDINWCLSLSVGGKISFPPLFVRIQSLTFKSFPPSFPCSTFFSITRNRNGGQKKVFRQKKEGGGGGELEASFGMIFFRCPLLQKTRSNKNRCEDSSSDFPPPKLSSWRAGKDAKYRVPASWVFFARCMDVENRTTSNFN